MEKDATFETGGAAIDLEKVTAFADADPAAAAEGTIEPALNVYLADGSRVPVRGEDEVQGFVEALEEYLEPADEEEPA